VIAHENNAGAIMVIIFGLLVAYLYRDCKMKKMLMECFLATLLTLQMSRHCSHFLFMYVNLFYC